MTARVLPNRDCIVCGSPVPPKPEGKRGPQPQVCSEPCQLQRKHTRYKSDNDSRKTGKASWHAANRDRVLADRRASQTAEDRARAAARTRQWELDNPERRAANRRAWAKANPEKVAAKTQRRLAILRGVPADLVTVTELLVDQEFRCHICGTLIDPKCKYPDPGCPTIDHVIPLSCGGSGLRGNLKAAHMRCNSGKGAKVMTA